MSKKTKLYIGLILATVLIIVALEMTKPRTINWFPSYALHHKIPLGSYVFNDQIRRLSNDIKLIDRPPYEFLKNNAIDGTYIFFNGGINYGSEELNALLNWVSKGNTLMVSAVDFEQHLLDTLNLSTTSVNTVANFNNEYQVQLANKRLGKASYKFDKPTTFYHFNAIDTLQTRVLGFIDTYRNENETVKDSLVNIIKQPFGNGEIILSTFPQAFSNYFILKSPNHKYTAGLLGYINTNSPIYLDTYYKSGKKFYTSPMYLFLSNVSLKWAYYLVLIGALIYVIFEGKRKQRAIPIVKPHKNQTVEFTHTIANMYYENSKHKDIAAHKIQHFLDYIRSTMHLQTYAINDEFISHLAARSNNSIEDTKMLFDFIDSINTSKHINDTTLEQLNRLIDNFKSKNTWKTNNKMTT